MLLPVLAVVAALVLQQGYWLWPDRDAVSREIITVPRSSLSSTRFLDRFLDLEGYDPRRSGVSLLRYVEGVCGGVDADCKVPVDWPELVNVHNKTTEGQEVLNGTIIERLIVINGPQMYRYEVKFGERLPLADEIDSISGSVVEFFDKRVDEYAEQMEKEEEFDEIQLTAADFQTLDSLDRIESLKDHKQRELLLDIYREHSIPETRYFKEGSLLHNKTLHISGLSHYDLRFYHTKLSPISRVAILHRIARSWLNFTRQLKWKTWIAHGSLLGYYFNGLILPWDDDLDVQISMSSFWELLEHNGTLVVDYQDDLNIGKYLIDINPWFLQRDAYNPENKIDARYIDLESGLYIDITVLTVNENIQNLNDLNQVELNDAKKLEISKVFEPYYEQILTETEILEERVANSMNESLKQQDELISCKDYHFYKISELTPLIPSIFEGEIGLVPNNIKDLIVREYGRRSLYLLDFRGFNFNRLKNLWISDTMDYEFNTEMDQFLELHYQLKQTAINRHVFHKDKLLIYPPFRSEPWIRDVITSEIKDSS
jgi:hypothetical protein